MRIIRWFLSFPAAMLASFIAFALAEKIFGGVHSSYGGGFFYSLLGLLPLLSSAAFPTVIFVIVGALVSPSQKRWVCFVSFGLSLLFSAGGIQMLVFQDSDLGFWLASASGIAAGAVIGLVAALRIQRMRKPPQRNAGSRPSSGGSPASATPSSLGPRG